MFIDILRSGAILIGDNFTIDGHADRNFRVVTHFHSDHLLQLKKSIQSCIGIIATPPTLDVLQILDYDIPKRKRIGINYNIPLKIENETIELYVADHIFGASQVVITNNRNERVGYTGDFKNPGKGTPILDVDTLVIDSTYGKPTFRRKFKNEIETLFADYVNDSLIYGPVRIYAYYGKIQEAMKVLRKNGITAPFIVDGKVKSITDVAIKYGLDIKDVFSSQDEEAKEIIKDGWYIEFKHYNESKNRDYNFSNFILSGWEFNEPVRQLDRKTKLVAFSDHGDFDDTIYYIDSSPASLIIVDGGRKGYSKELAEYVRKYLKRKAISLP
ncbi:MBL fold metallo-hydrolase [Acidianus sulfidivorans JP7]|uniref:Exonuclease n=1 Tax=Acidianus sulfidivorans JP7 TaxID=619593 RepID=A0A2U9IMV5_9CREN|nr:MBL fold metallo-hydrolase [Acidianus sulfidivorans]AWR97337.1 MBL fold metallo-hydrolase [Acidianus sulfidivorans JP7]